MEGKNTQLKTIYLHREIFTLKSAFAPADSFDGRIA